MEQKDKETIVADLCGRIPHGTLVHANVTGTEIGTYRLVGVSCKDKGFESVIVIDDSSGNTYTKTIDDSVKPILRRMEDITKEEAEEFFRLSCEDGCDVDVVSIGTHFIHARILPLIGDQYTSVLYYGNVVAPQKAIDYLNRIHIDHRGLIDAGLADEAKLRMRRFNSVMK